MKPVWIVSFVFLASCGGGDSVVETAPAETSIDADEETAPDAEFDSEEPLFDTGATGDAMTDTMADTMADAPTEAAADTGKLTCTGSQIEPNDSLPTARPLKAIDDCDGSGSKFSGTVGGADVDYWTYKGTDSFGCSVDPTIVNHSASVRVCIFAQCGSGPTEFKKCDKGTAFKLPSGLDGCCSDGPGTATLSYSCTLVGTDDSADIFMRVDSPGATTCLPYDVDYHF